MKRPVIFLLLLVFAKPVHANSCRNSVAIPSSMHVIRRVNGLTIVPFAIPVAVPVATLNYPSLFYGYSGYRSQGHAAQAKTYQTRANSPQTIKPNSESDNLIPDQVSKDKGAVAILTRRCAECHSGAEARGDLQIFHEGGNVFEKLPRHVILDMVSPNEKGQQRMPPGERPKLSPAEIKVLRDWAKLPRNAVY